MNELLDKVEFWAKVRGLDKADPRDQFLKCTEEFGEIAHAMARNNRTDLIDALGDTVVTLIILAQQHGLRIEECLSVAYGEIKDRKGMLIKGVFIKSDDFTANQWMKFNELNKQAEDSLKKLGRSV